MVGLHAEGLEVIVDSSPKVRSPDRGISINVLPTMSCGRMEFRAAKAWSCGTSGDQRVLLQQPEFQTGRLFFRTQEG